MSDKPSIAENLHAIADKLADAADTIEGNFRAVAALLEHTPTAFVGINEASRIVEWNVHAEKLFGWEKIAVMGKQITEVLIPERLRGAHHQGMKVFNETGVGPVLAKPLEMPCLFADGTERKVHLTIYHMPVNGAHFGAFISPVD